MARGKVLFSSFFCFLLFIPASPAQIDDATKKLSHDIFKQLIEINSTDSVGSVTAAAEAMAQRFRDAGFPEADIQILGPNDRKKNVVVRLHGTGKKVVASQPLAGRQPRSSGGPSSASRDGPGKTEEYCLDVASATHGPATRARTMAALSPPRRRRQRPGRCRLAAIAERSGQVGALTHNGGAGSSAGVATLEEPPGQVQHRRGVSSRSRIGQGP